MILIEVLFLLRSRHWFLAVFTESDVSLAVVYMHYIVDRWNIPLAVTILKYYNGKIYM